MEAPSEHEPKPKLRWIKATKQSSLSGLSRGHFLEPLHKNEARVRKRCEEHKAFQHDMVDHAKVLYQLLAA